jgi:beta-glucosidase
VDIISLGGKMGDGSNATAVMMEAVEMYMAEHGEEATLARLQESAFRITRNMLRLGLFENPYLDTKHSKSVVHCDEAQEDAYEACLKSVILLKNATNLIQSRTKKPTVYIPMIYKPATEGNPWRGTPGKPASIGFLSDARVLGEYFNIVTDTIGAPSGPADESGAPTLQASDIIRKTAEELTGVDFALVLINSPQSDGFNNETKEVLPKTLQYRTYIANGIYVRQTSISGDYITVTRQDTYGAQEIVTRENRSYYGKSVTANNESDLDLVEHVASVCENVVVAVRTDNPFIPAELDAVADSLLLFFNNNMYHTDIGANTNVERALYDVVAGNYEPSGLLPFQMPANMDTVEAQLEDIPRDCESYTDSQGNTYDFTFGLNWSDKIEDERVTKYNVKPLID